MTRTLDDIIVLDLTRLLPGAICSMLLADMGAQIIKIEDPFAGDYARWTPPLVEGVGAFFRASNRNKQSAVFNLKDRDGVAAFKRLVAKADVLIEGFRPGVTARLGIDYEALKAIHAGLVYVSLSGWGQDGPDSAVSGHDMNYVAHNGLLGSMRDPQALGGQIADVGGAYVGVMGVLAALFKRSRTGTGDYVDVALSESAMPFALYQIVEAVTAGLGGGSGTLTGGMAFYDVYRSADDQALVLAPIEAKFWRNFCEAVGHPEWIAQQLDMAQQAQLKAEISAMFRSESAQHWHDLLADADCCFSVVVRPQDAPQEAHIQARGMAGVDDVGVPWLRSPLRLSGDDAVERGDVPAQGEHTDSVLRQAGFTDDEIAALRAAGAVGKQKG